MNFTATHPDYSAADIPSPMPVGAVDITDHNSVAPVVGFPALGFAALLDYADVDQREVQDGGRFEVYPYDHAEHRLIVEDALGFDLWDDVLAFLIGERFAAHLLTAIGTVGMGKVRRENGPYSDSPVCASHNYCDANVFMIDAFRDVMGREPQSSYETHYDPATGRHVADDPAEEALAIADGALWSAAWKSAARRHLCQPAA